MEEERRLRVKEFCKLVPYSEHTVRKMIFRKQLAYHKVGRILVIPHSEVTRLLGAVHPVIENEDRRRQPRAAAKKR